MSGILPKAAPLLVVAAVFAWCCWPYVFTGDSVDHGRTGGDLMTIAKSLLSPATGTAHDRNPFLTADKLAEELLKTKEFNRNGAAIPGVPTPESAGQTAASFSLRATLVQGDRRLATIGNRVYRPGEPIDSTAPPDKTWIVSEVFPESVVLRRGKDTWTLTFTDCQRDGESDQRADTNVKADEPTEASPTGITSVQDLMRLLQSVQATGESP